METAQLYGKARKVPRACFAFVDPGVKGTGLAIWRKLAKRHPKPSYWQTLWAPRGATWDDAARQIVGCVRKQCILYCVRHMVIEVPQHWTGSARSAAAEESGDIIHLSIMIGMLMRAVEAKKMKTVLVTPSQWKGQLPKKAMRARIERAIGVRVSAHGADAVGMGLSALAML